ETISRLESMRFRAAITSAHLRAYVDAWLETGRRGDGRELPAQRNLSNARDALLACWDYLEKAPVKLRPSGDPSGSDFTGFVAEPTAYAGLARNFFEAQV